MRLVYNWDLKGGQPVNLTLTGLGCSVRATTDPDANATQDTAQATASPQATTCPQASPQASPLASPQATPTNTTVVDVNFTPPLFPDPLEHDEEQQLPASVRQLLKELELLHAVKQEAMHEFEAERKAMMQSLQEEEELDGWDRCLRELQEDADGDQMRREQWLRELEQQLQQAGEERSNLQQQVVELQEKLDTKDSLLQENCLQLEQAKEEEREGSELHQQVVELKKQLEDKDSLLQESRQELKQIKREREAEGAGRNELQQQVVEIQRQLQTKDGLLRENQLKLEQAQQQVIQLQKWLNTNEGLLQTKNLELDEVIRKRRRLRSLKGALTRSNTQWMSKRRRISRGASWTVVSVSECMTLETLEEATLC